MTGPGFSPRGINLGDTSTCSEISSADALHRQASLDRAAEAAVATWFSGGIQLAARCEPHSHSIVPGGFEVTS